LDRLSSISEIGLFYCD